MSGKETLTGEEEQKFHVSGPEAQLILEKFGEEALLRVYGLEGAGARVVNGGKGRISIECPRRDSRKPGKLINILPQMSLAEVIRLFGSEEATIEGLYRPLGYKGPIKFSRSSDGKEAVALTGLGDAIRTAPLGAKAVVLAMMLTVGSSVAVVCNDTPTGRAAQDFVENGVQHVFGGEENK